MRSSSDLKWWQNGDRYFPCRACDAGESSFINLESKWDTSEVVLIQSLEYPPTTPFDGRDRILAGLASVQPYGDGDIWDRRIWDKYNAQRRLEARQAGKKALLDTDVQAGYLYLNRILKAAKEKDVVPNTILESSDGNNSDLEIPYEVNLNLSDKTNRLPPAVFSEKKAEPLRPGDVIQYSSPIYCAGDPRGLRTATVLSTDPESNSYKIRLSNQEMLPNETRIKRIKELEGETLHSHNGLYKAINQFVMKKRSLDVNQRDLMKQQGEHIGRIVDRNLEKLRQNMKAEGLPAGFVQKFQSSRKQVTSSSAPHHQLQQRKKKKTSMKGSQSARTKCKSRNENKKHNKSAKMKARTSTQDSSSSSDEDLKMGISALPKESNKEGSSSFRTECKSRNEKKERNELAKTLDKTSPQDSSSSSDEDMKMRPFDLPKEPNKSSTVSSKKSQMAPNESDKSLRVLVKRLTSPKPMTPTNEKTITRSESESDSSLSNYKTGFESKMNGTRCALLSGSDSNIHSTKISSPANLYSDDDSESSLENEGLDLRRKKAVAVQSGSPSLRRPIKTVSIDRKTERILPAKRRYLSEKIDRDKQPGSMVFSKINARPAKVTEMKKLSLSSWKNQTSLDLATSCLKATEGSSYESDCIDLFAPTDHSRRRKTLAAENRVKEENSLARPKAMRHLQRIKAKGPYIVEDEDDIEDSGDDQRGQTPVSKRCKYNPVAQRSPRSKRHCRNPIHLHSPHSRKRKD